MITDAQVAEFQESGILIFPSFFTNEVLDAALIALKELSRGENWKSLVVDDLDSGARCFWGLVSKRQRLKINDLFLVLPEFRHLAINKPLANILSRLMGQVPVLCNGLFFEGGSGQPNHVDSLYMTPKSKNDLVATWVAMEDVESEAGPLIYYPRSHLIEPYIFGNGSNHFVQSEMADWNLYINTELGRREIKPFTYLPKKGDLLVWHAHLLHSGGAIVNREKTRKSYVSHYYSLRDCIDQHCPVSDTESTGFSLDRLPQPVVGIDSIAADSVGYPWVHYIRRHPDLIEAFGPDNAIMGRVHYDQFGFIEGRGL